MEVVIHRVNTIKKLQQIPPQFGCEIDIRTWGNELILNHDPFLPGDKFSDFLDEYVHGLLVLNIKVAGIEDLVLRECRKREIGNVFLLDVEFPYLYQASRRGERAIALRYSEDESIELVGKYSERVDWVWIDTNTKLPLDQNTLQLLKNLKTCLVCPERWGRPHDICVYRKQLKMLDFTPNAVMTALEYAQEWL